MASVVDVAEQVLHLTGPIDTYRLQKLVYYAQACHLAKYDEALFADRIEAWVNGPAVPRLYRAHRGSRRISSIGGDPERLSDDARESIACMYRLYGHQTSQWLVNQTHIETPWRAARAGLAPDASSNNPISVDQIRDYYRPILADPDIEAALDAMESEDGLTSAELAAKYL